MDLIYKTGDLMNAEEHFIVHGCNAQGVMGSGVAKLIRDRYPRAFSDYRQRYEETGLRVGMTIWVTGSPHTVINAITQEFYGKKGSPGWYPGRVYADYDGIRKAFKEINNMAIFSQKLNANWQGNPVDAVAMPLIGAGLANGSWSKIASIIEEESANFQPVVYLVDGVIPT